LYPITDEGLALHDNVALCGVAKAAVAVSVAIDWGSGADVLRVRTPEEVPAVDDAKATVMACEAFTARVKGNEALTANPAPVTVALFTVNEVFPVL
jgi:hypothetical protein